MFAVHAAGPHGLDLDRRGARLFCACDAGRLIALDSETGIVLDESPLSGAPDVAFFNAGLERLYVAIGDPGVIDVFDTRTMMMVRIVPTTRAMRPERRSIGPWRRAHGRHLRIRLPAVWN